jgi:hypothetical protein
MFVKIDSKLVLLKHKGLAPSTRKSKPKKPLKSPISSTSLQIPTNLQDQPTNPPNPRRRSDHFEEKLRIVQQEKTQKSASTHLHPSANSLEQKFKNHEKLEPAKPPGPPKKHLARAYSEKSTNQKVLKNPRSDQFPLTYLPTSIPASLSCRQKLSD